MTQCRMRLPPSSNAGTDCQRFEAITAEVQKAIDEANLKIVTTIPRK